MCRGLSATPQINFSPPPAAMRSTQNMCGIAYHAGRGGVARPLQGARERDPPHFPRVSTPWRKL